MRAAGGGSGRVAIVALLLVACGPAEMWGASPKVGEIEDLLAANRLEEAVGAGRKAVAAAPDDVDVRLALARALAAHGRRMERVVTVPGKPSESGGEIRLKLSDFQEGTLSVGYDAALFEEALLHLSEGIRRAPKRQDVRMLQCFLLTDGARIDRAAAAVQDAVNALPKTAELAKDLVQFGAERTKRGDPSGGARLIGIVAKAFPTDAEVQVDHGLSLSRLGRRADAAAALDRAASLAPRDVRIQRKCAAAAMILRDWKRAASAYEAAFAVSASDEDRFGAAAATYGLDPAAAVGLFEDLAAPAPSAPPAMTALARSWADAARAGVASSGAKALADRLVTDHQEILAIPVLDRIVAAEPGDSASRTKLADVLRSFDSPVLADEVARPRKAGR